jgi:phosphoribosylglycinamide formyltransferase 1
VQERKKSIVIFASGSGSNAKAILHRSTQGSDCNYVVSAIFCNNAQAGIVDWCVQQEVPIILFDNASLKDPIFLQSVNVYKPHLIVLAGFLRKIPSYLIGAFPQQIINIHPALLPKYGGKGMYGHFVHEAVAAAHDSESGITIHYVNEHYDEGQIIMQKTVALVPSDTPLQIAEKVLKLEHEWYWQAVESVCSKQEHP